MKVLFWFLIVFFTLMGITSIANSMNHKNPSSEDRGLDLMISLVTFAIMFAMIWMFKALNII
jgi:hypothetical protein